MNENDLPVNVFNLCKRYSSGELANHEITFTAESGEILGIVGPNGAGKTTLIRQITTELRPTSGNVYVFGIDVVEHPRLVKGMIGVMPQEATLYWGLKVHHQLRIFGKLRGLPSAWSRRRRDELISLLGLGKHRNKSTEELSGGLRRRVLLGIASIADPPLLILDEPSVGLDPDARRELWELLHRYRSEGKTILLTTHHMEEAEALCDRVGIIQDGTLLALDTIDNLRSSHGHEYKIVYRTDGAIRTRYSDDYRQLVDQLQAEGIDQYSVSRTTLDDIYLGVTGRHTAAGNDLGV